MTKWNHYNNKATEGKFLIKFLSKKNVFRFLDSGEVWFTRADKFGDKMECATIDDMKSKPFNFNKVIQRKQRHIISCWHHVGRESLAMWDTSYKTPEARRVYAIKFDTTLLIDHVTSSYFEESVEQIIKTKLHGKVIYKNLLRSQELLEGERIRNAAFRKEYAFHYEQEFRFVARAKSKFPDEGYGLEIGDVNELDYSIMVNPLLEKDEYQHYLDILRSNIVGENKHQDSELVSYLKPLEW